MLELLLAEKRAHPAAEARDYCKLLYQSEFGAGHIAADAQTSLARLRKECAACVNSAAEGEAPFTDVGGGLVRLHLRALQALKLRLETVNGLFAQACAPRGSVAALEEKLDTLRENAAGLGLRPEDVDAEIAHWRAAGYPALSHSQTYRALYRPAYRLVPAAAMRYLPLFQAIDALLAAVYGGELFHMDDFFLPPERKTPARLAELGGNVDRERFESEVLSHLGTSFSYRPWRCHPGAFAAPVSVEPRAVVIVEGVYSLHPQLRSAYDLRVFLSIAPEAQQARIRARSGEAMLSRFLTEWIPLENTYFDRLGVRACCQLAFEAE